MSFNLKTLRKATLLSAAILLVGFAFGSVAVAFEFDHSAVPLRDASGNLLVDGNTVPGTAYSTQQTCGACHDYEAIEKHSYHAQLAANDQYGFNPMNPDGDAWESGPSPKGKNWVQGQGHVGAW